MSVDKKVILLPTILNQLRQLTGANRDELVCKAPRIGREQHVAAGVVHEESVLCQRLEKIPQWVFVLAQSVVDGQHLCFKGQMSFKEVIQELQEWR